MRLGPWIVVVALVAVGALAVLVLGGVPRTRIGALGLAVGAGALAAALAMWLVRRDLVQPLEELVTAAEAVAPERIHERLRVETSDEEVRHLRDELNEALERLEGGYRAQESFISNVSHELKTPISVVLSEAQLVRRQLDDANRTPDRAEMLEFAESVEEEMRHLGRLVESFLTLTRAERGPRHCRRVPIHWNDVVLEAVRHVEPIATLHRVKVVPRLATNDGGGRLGDPDLLRTMVENLVRNAVRFSPPEERVVVALEADEGRELTLDVHDRGPGVPEELLPALFDRFVQAEGERARGTGLGLAIARRVAELHGGGISVENLPAGGCRFRVRFPAPSDAPNEEDRA